MTLHPDWPAPPGVRALMTTRDTDLESLRLPSEPQWLDQVHGTNVVRLSAPGIRCASPACEAPELPSRADASWTTEPGIVCVAKSADCLPVLFCADDGSAVGAAHAGWRGLAAGVLEATVAAMGVAPARLMAWMGAAIGPASFEVGPEVREAFIVTDPAAAQNFQARHPGGSRDPEKYLANLYGLSRQRLARAGVLRVYGGGLDTFADPQRFFSYRREGRTGRMAAMIWRAA